MVEIFMPNSLCPNPPISKTSFPPSSMGVKNKWLHTTPQTSSKGLLLMHWASLLTRGVGFSLEKRYDHCQDTIPPYKEGTLLCMAPLLITLGPLISECSKLGKDTHQLDLNVLFPHIFTWLCLFPPSGLHSNVTWLRMPFLVTLFKIESPHLPKFHLLPIPVLFFSKVLIPTWQVTLQL